MWLKIITYLRGVKTELKYVNWPTRSQTINYTLLVVGVSVLVAFFLGAADKFFAFLLNRFIL